MRWMLWLLAALLLGGCASLSGLVPPPKVVSQPPKPAVVEEVPCDVSSLRTAAEGMSLFPAGAFGADDSKAQGDDDDQSVPVDLETLADNLLLSGADQTPPDNEGVTVPKHDRDFDFPVVENAKVRYFIDFYTGPGRHVFTRWLKRSGRYIPAMRKIFADYGLPQDLAYLAMVESGFNERAYSWAHAVGPWQFIEKTGEGYGLKSDWWRDERRDFVKSTQAAARFLKDLNDRFDGNWYLAVAAYNAGGGKISRAVSMYHSTDFWTLSRGSFLQAETKNYLPKLLAVLMIAKHPEAYGFTDLDYFQPFDYEEVALPSATDLDVVARLCGVDYETIKQLNPELKRWCTPPGDKGYVVRIPSGTREAFVKAYAAMDPAERINYLRHRIRRGDTLLKLAKQHHIRVEDIISLNSIRNPRVLQVGTDLILPLSRDYTTRPLQELGDDYIHTHKQTYTVRSGDSLWKVSQKFGVSQKQLRVWNRLGWSNLLRPGQKLIVSSRAARGSRKNTAKHRGPRHKIIYQVRSGDTLWDIGRRYDVGTDDILGWNNLSQDHVLHPGDTLTLLVPTSRRS